MVGLGSIARKIFGSPNDRKLKDYQRRVERINALENDIAKLSDDELKGQTKKLKNKLELGSSLDDILEEAFATVREAAKRTLGQRHYDVQLIGGMVLHDGKIAEMRTGEGKTLVATLPTYLNALTGKGVHVVTVNDYLAKRDAEWMAQVYNFLGLSVGTILHGKPDSERKEAYECDITYGTNNEFGFDYLRDNMKFDPEAMVQRGHNFAIVDEVDSILIDEARTPLIISGPLQDQSDLYLAIDEIIPTLTADDYDIDEKIRSTSLTELGNEKLEEILKEKGLMEEGTLYDVENVTLVHHINQALRAHKIFERDRDYIVRNGQVIIIDEFTGRMMPGRRYSDGLHQALEARERVTIQPENQTLASVTFQNLFRLYDKLAGMTGTALTEADEFLDIYKLDVIEVPTNKPVARIDEDDEIYRTQKDKINAIIKLIRECQKRNQPVLVGTTSIEKSENLSKALVDEGIEHRVLNAKYHEQEAKIIAQAGIPGSVTIATNMAGRGTDIQLGGNLEMRIEDECAQIEDEAERAKKIEEIKADIAKKKEEALKAGGLYIVGTERHESRRIDNQLRGRSGRQGDPGGSKFFLSLEDDLMRIFGSDRMDKMLERFGFSEGEALIHPWINKALERAQNKVEGRNFDIRKNILKFDNVMNDQRKVIFSERRELMEEENAQKSVQEFIELAIESLIQKYIPQNAFVDDWDLEGFQAAADELLGTSIPAKDWFEESSITPEEIEERLKNIAKGKFQEKEEKFGEEVMRKVERVILLQNIDNLWREHLVNLDHLRQVIDWRGFAQKDPLNEYKAEAFSLFEHLIKSLHEKVTEQILKVEVMEAQEEIEEFEQKKAGPALDELTIKGADDHSFDEANVENGQFVRGAGNASSGGRRVKGKKAAVATASFGDNISPNVDRSNQIAGDEGFDPNIFKGVSRNAACPCGSGKKFKHCHGKL